MITRKKQYLKYVFIVPTIMIVLTALAITAYFINNSRAEFMDVPLHYLNTQSNEWTTEVNRVNIAESDALGLITNTVDRLQRIPELVPGGRAVSRGFSIKCALEGGICFVTMPAEYYERTAYERNITIASLVYSITEFDFVDDVIIMSSDGNQEILQYNRDNLLIFSEDLGDNIGTRTYRLYFADAASPGELAVLEREIIIQPNIPLETLLIRELIAGPSSKDYARLIPADASLRSNTTLDEGICYADFTQDFLARIDNEDNLLLTVYSIVRTITDNSSALQVQLLFGGDKTTVVLENHEDVDLSKPLSLE